MRNPPSVIQYACTIREPSGDISIAGDLPDLSIVSAALNGPTLQLEVL
jgi:hypothetical protein